MLKVAACQPRRTGDNEKDTERALAMIDQVLAHFSADLVVFPENYPIAPKPERKGGPLSKKLEKKAVDCGMNLVYGKIEKDGERLFKSAVVVLRDGSAKRCDKQTLFTDEKINFANGLGDNLVQIDGYDVGVLLCYDIFSPDMARYFATRRNADFLVAVTNTPRKMINDGLIRGIIKTRCYENSIPIVSCSMVYPEKDVYGYAIIVEPPNRVIDETKTNTDEEIVLGDLRPELYQDVHRHGESPRGNGYQIIAEDGYAPYVLDIRPEYPIEVAKYFEELRGMHAKQRDVINSRARELLEALKRGEVPESYD